MKMNQQHVLLSIVIVIFLIFAGCTDSQEDIKGDTINNDEDISPTVSFGPKIFGDTNKNILSDVIATSDGGFIFTGYNSFGSRKDVLVIKLDSDLNTEWSKTYGASNQNTGNSIIETNDGGFIVVGGTSLYGEGFNGAWVLKIDNFGEIIWQHVYGSSGSDTAYKIIQNSDGDYIIAGVSTSFTSGSTVLWVLKLDADGKIIWQNGYPDENYDMVFSVSLSYTSDETFLIAAGISEFFTSGSADFWFMEIDSSGSLLWPRRIQGELADVSRSIVSLGDQGFIVAGDTASSGAGGKDAWIIKYDNENAIEWQKTYGDTGNELATVICPTSDGGFIVAGSTTSSSKGAKDVWFAQLDNNGNILWQKTFGGEKDDVITSLITTADGGFLAAGYTSSFDARNTDFWAFKINNQFEFEQCLDIEDMSLKVSDTDMLSTPASAWDAQTDGEKTKTDIIGLEIEDLLIKNICE